MSRGEYSIDSLISAGNALIQRQILYTRWIRICLSKYLIPHSIMSGVRKRVLSFIRIFFSIFATCSCAAVVLTSSRPTFSFTSLDYTSIRTRRVTKPPLAYNFKILSIYLANCPAVRVGTYLQVINLIFR